MFEKLAAIVAEAGRFLASAPRREGHAIKADGTPVTAADLACEKALAAALAAAFPGLAIVAEESAPAGGRLPLAGMAALVDPLDGTRAFINGRDDFCVNLAIVRDGEPVIGVIGAPARRVLYAGRIGRVTEAWRAGIAPDGGLLGARTPLRSRRPAPHSPVGLVSDRHGDAASEALLARAGAGEKIGLSSALKFALLAEGAADLYPRFAPTMAWDTAAGQAILAAAGGETLARNGDPLRYRPGGPLLNPGFLAAGDPDLGRRLLVSPAGA